jgi:hypothetical protein
MREAETRELALRRASRDRIVEASRKQARQSSPATIETFWYPGTRHLDIPNR